MSGAQYAPQRRTNMSYKDFIAKLKAEWIGTIVSYKGVQHRVVDVDYNGCLLIDKPHYYSESYTAPTTAVEIYMVDKQG